MARDLGHLRESYATQGLHEDDLAADPFTQFERWFDEAQQAELPEPNAMGLATADTTGAPTVRTVLLKEVTDNTFVFYTNHSSHKGEDIAANPQVSLLFAWLPLARQVIVRGTARLFTAAESKDYWTTRPRGSQLGAWASQQSRMVEDRAFLEHALGEAERRFEGQDIPLPPHWGGVAVKPTEIEFWQGRPNRLHDRLVYAPDGDSWQVLRRSP